MSPDWCWEVYEISFSQLDPSDFKSVKRAQPKYRNLSIKVTKTFPTLALFFCSCKTTFLIVRSRESSLIWPLKPLKKSKHLAVLRLLLT